MITNSTIEVDSNLLDSVNKYAKSKGKTVSELLEAQLRRLVSARPASDVDAPVSFRLRGVVRLPKGFDYKQELENCERMHIMGYSGYISVIPSLPRNDRGFRLIVVSF